jgi:hypothetical protein
LSTSHIICFGLIVIIIVFHPFNNEATAFNAGPNILQARSFPNTRDGIYVFYDQLPFNLTEAQLQFAADHYVGCQKIPLNMVDALRQYNDQFIVLNYRLAFGTYEGMAHYLIGNDWINDWEAVNPHADWFITDPGSPLPDGRIRQTDWNWYLMDISGEINGNTGDGWKEYWSRTVIDQLRDTNCDGVFADSFTLPWNLNYTPAWLMPPDDVAWIHHMTVFGAHVRQRLVAQPEQFLFIPKVGAWITTRNTCDYGAFVDGVMVEMFASPGPWDLYDIEDWKLEMNRILDLESREIIVICQPITQDEWAVGERMYNLANYLLIKGEFTYYNLVFGENFYDRIIFFPECGIDLGPYIGNLPATVDALFDIDMGVYAREYENGVVLVNPTWDDIQVVLDKSYYTVDTGNLSENPWVDVNDDGELPGEVQYQEVSGAVTIGPKGGVILLNSITDVSENRTSASKPIRLKPLGNHPNPFNQNTTIRFVLEEWNDGTEIMITIYDNMGKTIKQISPQTSRNGINRINWDGMNSIGQIVSSGVYLYEICVKTGHETIRRRCGKTVMLK